MPVYVYKPYFHTSTFSYKWQAGLFTFIRFNPLPVLRLF